MVRCFMPGVGGGAWGRGLGRRLGRGNPRKNILGTLSRPSSPQRGAQGAQRWLPMAGVPASLGHGDVCPPLDLHCILQVPWSPPGASCHLTSWVRGRNKHLALPSNSQAPKGPLNAQDEARAGVNPWGVWFQTPTGSQASAEIRGPLVLHLWEDELKSLEEWRGGSSENLELGAWDPRGVCDHPHSVSPAALLLRILPSTDTLGRGFSCGIRRQSSGPSCQLARSGDFQGLELQGGGGIYF